MGIGDKYLGELESLKEALRDPGIRNLENIGELISHDARQYGISDREAQEALEGRAETLRKRLVWARQEIQDVLAKLKKSYDPADIEYKFAKKLEARKKEMMAEGRVEEHWDSLRKQLLDRLTPCSTLNQAVLAVNDLASSNPAYKLVLFPHDGTRIPAHGLQIPRRGPGCTTLSLEEVERRTLMKRPFRLEPRLAGHEAKTYEGRLVNFSKWKAVQGQFIGSWMEVMPVYDQGEGYFYQLDAYDAGLK